MTQLAIAEILSGAKCIPITKLADEIKEAREKGRYCLIFDKNENCSVFFKYKATMRNFHRETVAVTMGKKSKDEAMETIRTGLVYCMRKGETFVVNVDKLTPDFKTEWQDQENLPMDLICDFDEFREDENYKKLVKEDEDEDMYGGKGFFMQDTFTMVFLATYQNDETMVEVFNNIPGTDMMQEIIVDP